MPSRPGVEDRTWGSAGASSLEREGSPLSLGGWPGERSVLAFGTEAPRLGGFTGLPLQEGEGGPAHRAHVAEPCSHARTDPS